MLHPATSPRQDPNPPTHHHTPPAAAPITPRIGVGIDTARYGHYAAFLNSQLLPAADELPFTESADGYLQLRQRLQRIAQQHPEPLHFHIRLDAAGQYADNLLHFLQRGAVCPTHPDPLPITLSCGDPQRNKNYRAALFGTQKSDPIEARAAARYALNERPKPWTPPSLELRQLRQIAGRLQAVTRQRTRLINQLHQLLVGAFPELAVLVKDLSTGWVLELLCRYPTATRLATVSEADLSDIPYLPTAQIAPLRQHAQCSIASLVGPLQEELVRDQVRQLRDTQARQKRLENLLVSAYRSLPTANHLDTIKGLGEVTAAILSAFIGDIDRFETPGQLVAYFGCLPIEASSGVERDGSPRGPRRYVMSQRGNDLVRRYLWMAALTAVQHNPAVRPLYLRVIAKHPKRKAIAIGHAMRKLLHLAFAIWKSGRPFDATHYRWETPAHVGEGSAGGEGLGASTQEPAAGHKPASDPARKVVSAASGVSVATMEEVGEGTYVDFAHLKQQLRMERVLDQLGLTTRLQGSGTQRRCACPIHRGDGRSRTFSVNLTENVFCCNQASCGKQGDVIDLWAALHGMELRAAALDLIRTFGLEPAPATRTEKRNGSGHG